MKRLRGIVGCVVLGALVLGCGVAAADERDAAYQAFKEFLFAPEAPPPESSEWTLTMPFRDLWEMYAEVAEVARLGAAEAERLRGVVERLRGENEQLRRQAEGAGCPDAP